MRERIIFVARDGREFPNKALCRKHERETAGTALIGLTKARVEAARNGLDPELAEAIETFAYELRQKRGARQHGPEPPIVSRPEPPTVDQPPVEATV
jgi:hypothetical protein